MDTVKTSNNSFVKTNILVPPVTTSSPMCSEHCDGALQHVPASHVSAVIAQISAGSLYRGPDCDVCRGGGGREQNLEKAVGSAQSCEVRLGSTATTRHATHTRRAQRPLPMLL